jgi:hypothetical protein
VEPTTYLCSYKTSSSVLFDMGIKGQEEFLYIIWNGFHVFHRSIQSTAARYYIERRLIPSKYTNYRLQHLIKPHLTRPSGFYFISWSLWVGIVPWVSKFFLSEHAMIIVLCSLFWDGGGCRIFFEMFFCSHQVPNAFSTCSPSSQCVHNIFPIATGLIPYPLP